MQTEVTHETETPAQDEPTGPTPARLERAMGGYLAQGQVAGLLGITGAAVSNRPVAFRREHGGIQVPGGWLYSIAKLKQSGWVPAERLPAVPVYKVPMPTEEEIEQALAAYVGQGEVAKRLGISRAAMAKRPDWVKREMGGILTPNGWLFDPAKLAGHDALRGRPSEERKQAAPAVDNAVRDVDNAVRSVYPKRMTTLSPSERGEITTPVLSVRLPSIELRKALTERCAADGMSVSAFIADVVTAYVDNRLKIIAPPPGPRPSYLVDADPDDAG